MREVGCRLLERKFTGVPANYLINKNKDISYSSFGYTEQKQRMLKEKVEELLK
jgi:hypothetical protein